MFEPDAHSPFFTHNPLPMWVYDRASLCFLAVNEAAVAEYGWSREEFLDMRILDIRPPQEHRRLLDSAVTPKAPHRSAGTWLHRTRSGDLREVAVTAHEVSFEGRPAVFVVAMDVTGQRRAEAALLEEQAFSRWALDSLPGVFYAFTPDGTLVRWNHRLEEVTGLPAETLARTHPLDLIAPEDRERVRLQIEATLHTGAAQVEAGFLVRGGGTVPYYFTGRRMDRDDTPLLLGMGLDVSERVKAEEALLQARKLESLGVLAGGVAHDFNNLLAAMTGSLELAEMDVPGGSPALPHLRRLGEAIDRAAGLCRQMLAYSGKGRFVVGPLDLNGMVLGMEGILRASLPGHVALELDLGPDLPRIEADRGQLEQALANLVANGREAIGEAAGTVTLRTLHRPESGQVCLEVRDTGCGMDAETQARIFDPFFTTKFPGRGLGLAVLLGIMRGNGGSVSVESAPGAGATFRLCFPALAAACPAPAPRKAWRGEGPVLVVEDEAAVRTTLAAFLGRMGFEPVEAPDGLRGLEAFMAHRSELRLALVDLTMPGLDGIELARRIRESRPGFPVVLMSGRHGDEALASDAGARGFLRKPFRFPELAEVLRATLQPPATALQP